MNVDKKILIIRLSSIGDILLTTPFIRQTRIAFPNSSIDFVIKQRFIDLVRFNPHINHIYSVNEEEGMAGLREIRKRIEDQHYDYIFDLHNNIRSRILTKGLPNPIFRMRKDKLKRFLLVYTKINLYKRPIPIPERYLRVGRAAGIKDDGHGLEIFWKNHIEEGLFDVVDRRLLKNPFVAMAPGAGFKTKRWPIEYFAELIRKIRAQASLPVVLLGSKEEAAYFKSLEELPGVINLAGELTLLEAAIMISKAKFLVSNDSGLMHLATAVKTPVLAIFGSTVEEFGFFPYRSQHQVVQRKGLWCRPCSHIGRNHCPLGHFKCMKDLKPELVFNHLKKWL